VWWLALAEHLTLEWSQLANTTTTTRTTGVVTTFNLTALSSGRFEQVQKFVVVVRLYEITNARIDHFILQEENGTIYFYFSQRVNNERKNVESKT
jgi:hypothetical protein